MADTQTQSESSKTVDPSTKIQIEDEGNEKTPKKISYENYFGTLIPPKRIKSFYDANAFAILTTLFILYFLGLLIGIVLSFYLCALFDKRHLATWSWDNFLNTFIWYTPWDFTLPPTLPPLTP